MEAIEVLVERNSQQIDALQHEVSELKAVQVEIKTMNETLILLANELKHTNEHLNCNENKINEIEKRQRKHMQQIITAVISALAGSSVSTIISNFFH